MAASYFFAAAKKGVAFVTDDILVTLSALTQLTTQTLLRGGA